MKKRKNLPLPEGHGRLMFLFEAVKKASLLFADRCTVIDIVLRLVCKRIVKALKQILLLLIKAFGHLNNNLDILVSPASAGKSLYTSALEAEHLTGLSACRKLVLDLTVKGRNIKCSAQGRLSISNVELAPDVKAVSFKEGMRSYVYVDPEVACRTAVDAGVTAASD